MDAPRRGVILPIVLVIIGLLAMTTAGFIFFVRAETAGTIAFNDGQQARLTAESGLEEIIATLRLEGQQHNVAAWYDRPSRFRHALVWAETYDREGDPVRKTGTRETLLEEFEGRINAWRFSVVADSYDEPADAETKSMRFGITPEAGKLHLNVATDEQIHDLLAPLLFDLQVENGEELIAALLDWRDPDDDVRDGGAENEYYNSETLEPPYMTKNGPFDSVEELLLVKGFSAAILYGEDWNRNGMLDPNEDDGELSFPYYDTEDGVLNRGIAPFLTIWSGEPDTCLDNQPRINLNGEAAMVAALIETTLTEDELAECEGAINFIIELKQDNFNFSELGSPAELFQSCGGLDEGEGAGGIPEALACSPITLEEMPCIMDRFSVRAVQEGQPLYLALINVNTAPQRVLEVIPGMTPEAALSLVQTRPQLDAGSLRTSAWPLTSGAVDLATFHAIAPHITTKAYQFHVEVLGYADHVQASQRYEWIIEMAGPLAQVRYWRDLTSLGRAWPIDDEEIAGEGVEMGALEG